MPTEAQKQLKMSHKYPIQGSLQEIRVIEFYCDVRITECRPNFYK